MANYAVFRSPSTVRAVKLGKPGTGIPEGQNKRDDERFGVTVDSVSSPEEAIWKASLEYHGDVIAGLITILGVHLNEVDWDRDGTNAECVDSIFRSLKHLHAEGLLCTRELKHLTPHWTVPTQDVEPTPNPDQLTLI